MANLYQVDCQCAPWHIFRYYIKNKDTNLILYQVRRSGFRKYRQFEDIDNKILYYIGIATIRSPKDNEDILANIYIDKQIIETIIGCFTLTDLDICQRNYTLKLNDHIIAQVTRKRHLTGDRLMIEINDIDEQHQTFIFALFILIDSVLETIQNPTIYSHSIDAPISYIKK